MDIFNLLCIITWSCYILIAALRFLIYTKTQFNHYGLTHLSEPLGKSYKINDFLKYQRLTASLSKISS